MVSVKKNAKLLTRLLAILLLAIWGEVAYQLFLHKSVSPAGSSGPAHTIIANSIHARKEFKFKDNVRDPFAYVPFSTHVRKKPKVIPLIVHRWSPPKVSLEGIILGDGKKTAILSTETGQTYFLAKGDTLKGVKILKVDDREVAYRYQKRDTSWTVRR